MNKILKVKTLVFSIIVLFICLDMSVDFSGNGGLIGFGSKVYATGTSMNVSFPSSTSQSRSQTVNIPNLYSVSSMTVDTGSVTYNVSGSNVTINVSSGGATSSYTPSTYATSSVTNTTGVFDNYIWKSTSGYSGYIYKSGSYTMTLTDASPADSKTVTRSWVNVCTLTTNDATPPYYYDDGGSNPAPSTISYNDGTYSGTLSKVPPTDCSTTYSYWTTTSGTKTIHWTKKTNTYTAHFSGTVSKPDTSTWSYTQNYAGYIYGSTTYYYSYNVTVNYVTNVAPSVSIISPSANSYFSANADKNAVSLSGTIYDSDIGDTDRIYYRIDGSTGQAGTQYGNPIVSNNTNQTFPSPSQSINVSAIPEGSHTLYVWVQDSCGGKSAETAIPFKMDKTAPIVNAPTLTADSISQITVHPNAEDPVSNGVNSGLNGSTPYMYNKSGMDAGGWQSGNYIDSGLAPNTSYTYKYKARDNALNAGDYSPTSSIYTLAEAPKLFAGNYKSFSIDLYTSDGTVPDRNPSYTKYRITCKNNSNDIAQYVSASGELLPAETLSSDPSAWIELTSVAETNKKITVSNLAPGTTYSFQITAMNGDGVLTAQSPLTSGTTLVAPPNAPVNLHLVSGTENSLTLAWDPVTGATGYEMCRNDGIWMSAGNSTTYTDTGLNGGTSYTYKVRTVNGGDPCTSLPSESVTAVTKPAIPGGLVATPSADSIAVAWDAVSCADSYSISADGVTMDGITETSYIHNSLTPNSRHSYKLMAVNQTGESPWTSVLTKYTLAAAPNNCSIGTVTNTAVSASWGANGNSDGTEYSLAAYGSDDVLVKRNAWTTSLSDTITGLNPDTTYKLKVMARNGDGTTTESVEIGNGTETLQNPTAIPSGLSAVTLGKTSIQLTWNASEGAAGYEIMRNGELIPGVVTETTYMDTALTPGTDYLYTVQAVNNGGGSGFTTGISQCTLHNPPASPEVVETNSSTTTITITWHALPDADGYKIEADGLPAEDIGNVTAFTFEGLGLNSQHDFRILAYNDGGDGDFTPVISAYTLLATPTNVTASSSSDTILVSWDPVSGAASYELTVGENSYTTADTSFACGGLIPLTAYAYKVKAVSPVTQSEWSEEKTKTTLVAAPAVPGNFTASVTKTTVAVSWDPVNEATGYDVMADGQLYTYVDGTSFVQTGLNPGTSHKLQVRARNSGGKSSWSDEFTLSTEATSPDVPANIIANVTVDTISVQWDAVGGADKYEIEIDGGEGIECAENSYPSVGLSPGSTHSFRVRAVKADVPGEWSEILTATTRSNNFGIPTDMAAVPSDTSAVLTWSSVEGATGYDVEVDGQIFDNGISTAYTATGFQAETRHVVRVRTQNNGEPGDWSETVCFVTSESAPQAPVSFTAAAGETDIVLIWSPVIGVQSYDIEIDGTSQNVIGTTLTVNGLAPSTQHDCRVRSLNANGASAWSPVLTVSTLSDIPAVPSNVKFTTAQDSVVMTWNVVAGAGQYEIEVDGGLPTILTTDTRYINSGLESASEHTYRVRSINGANYSDWSDLFTQSTLPDKPAAAPDGLSVTPSENSIAITFNAAEGATGYDILVNGVVYDAGESTEFTLGDLPAGAQQAVRVRAKNAGGSSEWSKTTTVLTTADIPGAVNGINATSSLNSISLSWTPLEGAVNYDVMAGEAIIYTGTGTSCTDIGLVPGTSHEYRIRANNSSGNGVWSSTVTVATELAIPANLAANNTGGDIAITWDAVEGAEFYNIEVDGQLIEHISGVSYTCGSLGFGSKHKCRIMAENSVATSPWSSIIEVVIPEQVFTGTYYGGQEFDFSLSAQNLTGMSNIRFVITYDPSLLEAIDLYSLTDTPDLSAGSIPNSNIKVVQFIPGRIVIMLNETGINGEYSGNVGVVKFRSKTDGEAAIAYSMN